MVYDTFTVPYPSLQGHAHPPVEDLRTEDRPVGHGGHPSRELPDDRDAAIRSTAVALSTF